MSDTFRLNPEQVGETFEACAGRDVEVDMIIAKVSFDKIKLMEHAELIGAMLLELPLEFRQSGGGGWSFLQACMDRHGNQWTGLHLRMGQLFAMGEALGLVKCPIPRTMWSVLPGGMPYYIILDKQT